ncbi:MAG: dihydrolipoamide acetyltransferase family protein [Anaerolineales bacterium]|jgi:pyruvate dehydrogenase E2 component (dihydrolipoamide acetyltransferase)
MAKVVNMPKLGFDMAEGTLVRWVVNEGEKIEQGDVLAEIETDKATVEVEASASGVVLKHAVETGTSVPVGTPIAVIGEENEQVDMDSLLQQAGKPSAPPENDQGEKPQPEAGEQETRGEPQSGAEAIPAQAPGEGYPDGVKASPVARRVAEEEGLNLQRVQGSGPGGRIVKKDVEAALKRAQPVGRNAPLMTSAARETERVPISKLRGAIGKRMTRSKQELPHFYVTTELDARPVMEARAQINAAIPEDEKLSVNDFIVRAASLALREFPNLNASLDGEEIVRHGEINIGIAVAVEQGLLTVVARQADRKPISVLSSEIRSMANRAREGKVRPDDVEGSTFTVSNLGMFDVDHFIAIINPPEAAILAIGSVREVPLLEDGALVSGKRLKVTISADHRVTDGAEAARWLQVFKRYMEHPLLMLI